MKKLLITVMVLALALTGCETKKKSYDDGEKVIFDRFVVLENVRDLNSGHLYTVYDKETKVEYYFYLAYGRGGMCPVYNADGTVKVYEGE